MTTARSTQDVAAATDKPAAKPRRTRTPAVQAAKAAPSTVAEPDNEAPAAPEVPAAAPVTEPVAAPAQAPAAKLKLVRDSFTMPQADFALIAQLKTRALGFQRPAKKSELLRAGLQALAALNDEVLKAVLAQLPEIKTGRPRKGH